MKFLKALALGAALALTVASNSASAETTKIALLVKNLGNGFFDAANRGAQEAAKELGDVEVIYTGPTQAMPEGQIDIINSLVAQGVNAIAVSANDADALVPALKKARERKITVISFDSGVAKAGRQMNFLVAPTDRSYAHHNENGRIVGTNQQGNDGEPRHRRKAGNLYSRNSDERGAHLPTNNRRAAGGHESKTAVDGQRAKRDDDRWDAGKPHHSSIGTMSLL